MKKMYRKKKRGKIVIKKVGVSIIQVTNVVIKVGHPRR